MFSVLVFPQSTPPGTVEGAVEGAFLVKQANEADVCVIHVLGGTLTVEQIGAVNKVLRAPSEPMRKLVYLCGEVVQSNVPQSFLASPQVYMERGLSIAECLWVHKHRLSGGLSHA